MKLITSTTDPEVYYYTREPFRANCSAFSSPFESFCANRSVFRSPFLVVPCKLFSVPFSVRIIPCTCTIHHSVQSVPIVQSIPTFETPSAIHCKLTCSMEIYKYFHKTIKTLRLILSVNLSVRGLSKKFVDISNFLVNNNVNRRKV
jgi:hypothetical protein